MQALKEVVKGIIYRRVRGNILMTREDIIFYKREVKADFNDEVKARILKLQQSGINVNQDSKIRLARIIDIQTGKELIYIEQFSITGQRMVDYIPLRVFDNPKNKIRLDKFKILGFGEKELLEVWEVCVNHNQDFPLNDSYMVNREIYTIDDIIRELREHLRSNADFERYTSKTGIDLLLIPISSLPKLAESWGYKKSVMISILLNEGIIMPTNHRKYRYKHNSSDKWSIAVYVDKILEGDI